MTCTAALLTLAVSAATPRELADEYCFHTNATWCIDKDGDGTRESAPQLHPRFTEEGIEHLREKDRYFDPNDVVEYDPDPTPTPTPTAAPTAPLNYSGSAQAELTEDKSKRTRAKATITLASSWSAAWYYEADTGTHANSCTAVDAGTNTVNLTGLGTGTRFTYTAYTDANCTVALDSVAFSTAVTAGNNNLGTNQAGRPVNADRWLANSFTTGPHSAGYDLKQIIGKFNPHNNDPDPIRVAIHAASGSAPANNPLMVLHNFNGDPEHTTIGGQIFHFRCASTTCALQSGTTYFVVVSIPNSSKGSNNDYRWQRTTEDGQTLHPSNNGWSLGDVLVESTDGGSSWTANSDSYAARFDVVAFPR